MVIFLLETPPNLEEELNYAGNLTTTIASSRARCDFLIFSSFLDDDKSIPTNDAAVLMHSELITQMDVQKLPFFKKKYLFDSTYFSRYTKLDILKKKLH